MSITSKARTLLTGELEVDPDVEKIFDRVREYEGQVLKTSEKITRLTAHLLEKQKEKLKAATQRELTGNDSGYTKLSKELDALAVDVAGAKDAMGGLKLLVEEAKAEAHALGIASYVKTQKRINGQRRKAGQEFEEAMIGALKAALKLVELGNKTVMSWPSGTIGEVPGGAILSERELQDALTREVTRLAPYEPIGQRFTFPGAHVIGTQDNPTDYRSLVEELDLAGDYLIRKIEGRPATQPELIAPVSAPVVDEVPPVVTEQASEGRIYNAAEAAATFQRPRLDLASLTDE